MPQPPDPIPPALLPYATEPVAPPRPNPLPTSTSASSISPLDPLASQGSAERAAASLRIATPPLDPLSSQERGQEEGSAYEHAVHASDTYYIWQRFCRGVAIPNIASELGVSISTVLQSLHDTQQQLLAAEQSVPDLARLQAIQSQLAIQAAAWKAYDTEVAREDEYVAAFDAAHAPASKPHPRSHPDWLPSESRSIPSTATRPTYRAQRARLLVVASTAAWRAAQLQGLTTHPTPPPSPTPSTLPTPWSAPLGPDHVAESTQPCPCGTLAAEAVKARGDRYAGTHLHAGI